MTVQPSIAVLPAGSSVSASAPGATVPDEAIDKPPLTIRLVTSCVPHFRPARYSGRVLCQAVLLSDLDLKPDEPCAASAARYNSTT